jgi:sulfite reductase beta subunit-like hemoprotein
MRIGELPQLENRAGFILPVDFNEIDEFSERARKFRIGDEDGHEFQLFRLSRGVYGQRQLDNQMVRIKLPFGGVTAEQMEALAEVSEQFSGLHRGHITTRENIQFHFVNLDNAAEAMRIIGAAGLTSREACAHTVRNITGCPYAGIAPEEAFDTTPWVTAYARYMLRNPICQRLPRKFKTSFSNCPDDCAGSNFHDLGFIARKRIINGREVHGFEIRVGGGTSTMPRLADTICDFATLDDGAYIRVSEAVLRVFDREGDLPNFLRRILNKARLKFLIHKIGLEAFREMVDGELQREWAWQPIDMATLSFLPEEVPSAPAAADNRPPAPGFERWRRTNVSVQKQPGFNAAAITIPMGNISTSQFRDLARIMRTYCGGHARTNQNQNLVLRWIRTDELAMVHRELSAIGFGGGDADMLIDVVGCPGADSCKLAITSSNQAGYSMREELIKLDHRDPQVEKLSVKISGCPNGCGQHHLADIGLQGASYRVGKLEVPCYDIFVGGGGYRGASQYAGRVTRVLAKKAHLAIDRVLNTYLAERSTDDEPFIDYVNRVGAKHFEPLLEEFKLVGSLAEEPEMYMDWGHTDLFEVIRGEGECAVGEVPVIREAIEAP